jgi:hypothetical protein
MKKIKQNILENLRSYTWILLGVLCFLLLLFIFLSEEKEFHVHADFKVILNGVSINFSEDQYQSAGFNYLHEGVHLHDGNGDVIHYHAKNINLSVFFDSLTLGLTDSCFGYSNQAYCTNSTHALSFYLNGEQVESISSYVVEDLDRILIAYERVEIDTKNYLNLVTDRACIESVLCPERGEPSEGSCITGETCVVNLDDIK